MYIYVYKYIYIYFISKQIKLEYYVHVYISEYFTE